MDEAKLKALDALFSEIIAVLVHQPMVPHTHKISLLQKFDDFRVELKVPVEIANNPEA